MQDGAQGLRERPLRHWLGRRRIQTTFEMIINHHPVQHADQIVHADPTHALTAGSDRAPGTQLEGQQHLAQRTTLGGEHDADPWMNHPNAGGPRRIRRALPGRRDVREKPLAGGRRVINLLGAIPVIAHRTGGNEHRRRRRTRCHGVGDHPRTDGS